MKFLALATLFSAALAGPIVARDPGDTEDITITDAVIDRTSSTDPTIKSFTFTMHSGGSANQCSKSRETSIVGLYSCANSNYSWRILESSPVKIYVQHATGYCVGNTGNLVIECNQSGTTCKQSASAATTIKWGLLCG